MRRVISVMFGGLVGTWTVTFSAAQDLKGYVPVVRAQTCTTSDCHPEVTQHKRMHEPASTNRCDACHVPKQGATPFQAGIRHEFKRAGDNPELCYACHDRLTTQTFVHEPVKMGVCILCHDPHGAEHAFLIRVSVDRGLCAQCHRVTFDQGKHVHPPVGDGTCSACHDPHGSEEKNFIRAAAPELCLDCHNVMEELLDDATVAHNPATAGSACLNCHDPHVSNIERLLKRDEMALCLSCHDKEVDSENGKIRNMADYLKANANHHGPLQDKNCSACHNPHGGTNRRLLTGAYPAGPYAPFDDAEGYALCFACHDVEMVEEEQDDEVTAFRNGNVNLHYVHVNREDKGCTCGACHDAHAGAGPEHIADPKAVGPQASLTRYEATASGGSCLSSCHKTWAYDRATPVHNE